MTTQYRQKVTIPDLPKKGQTTPAKHDVVRAVSEVNKVLLRAEREQARAEVGAAAMPDFSELPDPATLKQVAQALHCSEQTIRRSGIPYAQVGGFRSPRLYRRADVFAFLERQTVRSPSEAASRVRGEPSDA